MNRYTRAIQKKVLDPQKQDLFIRSSQNHYGFSNLYRVRIETSSACNLRCIYCPTGTDYNNPQFHRQIMPTDVFDRIIQQLGDFQELQTATMYLGGEPLLNKDLLPNIQRLLDETTINQIQLVTNGMLITESFCRQLATIENFDLFTIEVSIDGRHAEDNDLCRRGSNYEILKNNVIMLRKMLPDRFLIQIANAQVPTTDEIYSTPRTPDYLRSDFSELPGGFGSFGISSFWTQVWPGLDDQYLVAQGYKKKAVLKTNPCVFPIYEISIRANGDIVPCCYDILSNHVMGNVCDESLREIIDSQQYRKLREALFTYYAFGESHLLPAMCKKCVLITNEILCK